MGVNEIKQWLNEESDFNQGVSILEKLSHNQTVVSFVKKGESIATRIILKSELEKLLKKLEEKKQTPLPFQKPASRIQTQILQPDSVIIKEIETKRTAKFKEAAFLHATLKTLDPEEMFITAERILLLWEEIDLAWIKIECFNQTGKLPEEPKDKSEITNGWDAYKRVQNLDTYISKAKSRGNLELVAKHKEEKEFLINKYGTINMENGTEKS